MPPNAHSMSTAANVAHHVVRHVSSADPLAALTKERWAVEGASNFWASFLQAATVIVVLGVVIEVIATALEVRDEIRGGHKIRVHHFLTFIGGALVVLAVAGEFWAEIRGASLETKLRTDNALAQAILSDRSNTAITDVVLTIARFGGLKHLVGTTEKRIAVEVSGFKKSTAAEIQAAKQTIAQAKDTIAELNRDRAELTKARDETQAAEKKAEAVVAAAAAANAPREIVDLDKVKKFVGHLSQFSGVKADIFLIHAPSPDAAPFAQSLLVLLSQAHWKVRGVVDLMGGPAGSGVLVITRSSPSPTDKEAAAALIAELRANDIPAAPSSGVSDEPWKNFGAFVGPDLHGYASDIWVLVGSK
jgi:hypothetical protein